MSNENKDSKLHKMLAQGCIAEYYTLNGYFVKIYPVLKLDKIKFSFVKKGEKGSGFDIYVDMVRFLRLCKDIISRRMEKLIAEDKGEYPSAWKYVTGNDGSKTLAIGKARNGAPLINGSVKGDDKSKKYAMVPLTSYEDLLEMADLFMVVTGYTPVTGYWSNLKKLFEEAQANNQKYYQNADDDEPQNQTQTVTDTTSKNEKPKEDNKANTADANTPEHTEQWGRFTPTEYGAMGNGFAVKTKDGAVVIFSKKVYKNTETSRVDQLEKMLKSGKRSDFTCTYAESKGNKYFLKFA